MTVECQFCKKTFPKESNLKRHQTSSQKCLIIQNKNVEQHICQQCNKSFARKYCLDRHLKTCNKKSTINQITINQPLKNKVYSYTNKNDTNNEVTNNTVHNIDIDLYKYDERYHLMVLTYERLNDDAPPDVLKRSFIVENELLDMTEFNDFEEEEKKLFYTARVMEICSVALSV
jgi:hypothetical protein